MSAPQPSRSFLTTATLSALALVAAACGTDQAAETGAGDGAGDDVVAVAASTNVWGSVAEAVGGDHVDVTPIIEDPAADPHFYESTPEDGLIVEESELFVYNGGGFDAFAEQLAEQDEGLRTVDAFELSGFDEDDHGHDDDDDDHDHDNDDHGHDDDDHGHDDDDHGHDDDDHGHDDDDHGHNDDDHGHNDDDHGHNDDDHGHNGDDDHGHNDDDHDHDHGHDHGHGANEHVWYDMPTVAAVASDVADELGEMDPENAEEFQENAAGFAEELSGLEDRLNELGQEHPELAVVATEPVAHYLFEHAGIEDLTPGDFADAIEHDTDVPVAAQDEMNTLVDEGAPEVVVNNPQTETPVTQELVARAEDEGIPVIEITETFPEGQSDFIDWVAGQIDDLEAAAEQ